MVLPLGGSSIKVAQKCPLTREPQSQLCRIAQMPRNSAINASANDFGDSHATNAIYQLQFITPAFTSSIRMSLYDSNNNTNFLNEDSVYLSPAFNKNSGWTGLASQAWSSMKMMLLLIFRIQATPWIRMVEKRHLEIIPATVCWNLRTGVSRTRVFGYSTAPSKHREWLRTASSLGTTAPPTKERNRPETPLTAFSARRLS